MTLRAQALLNHRFPVLEQVISARDAACYALSVGYGQQGLTSSDLPHLVIGAGTVTVPSIANVIGHPGPWLGEAGADWGGVVHGEQRLRVFAPVPIGVALRATTRTLSVVDRGKTGLFVSFQTTMEDPSGTVVATRVQTDVCRRDGGAGSAGAPPEPLEALPDREPDLVLEEEIPDNAALLYQLNGDTNPLHVVPAAARKAGYPRPILHGLCTLGRVGRLLSDRGSLFRLDGRFSSVTYPGSVLRVEVWDGPEAQRFRVWGEDASRPVIDKGKVEYA